MRKLIFGMLLVGIVGLFFACQKENSLETAADLIKAIEGSEQKSLVTISQLPEKIHDYVDLNYTFLGIEAAWHVRGKGYLVELEDGEDLYFRENGNCLGTRGGREHLRCMKGDIIAVEDLPTSIKDYIITQYPNATITAAVSKRNRGFAVQLSNGEILLFKSNGEFVNICGRFDHPGHVPGHGHGPHHRGRSCTAGDTIEVSDLPASVTDYVNSNYTGQTIVLAILKPSGKYATELSSGTVLLFDDNGNFLKVCDGRPNGLHPNRCSQPITLADLPQAAQDYIATKYPDATLVRGCLKQSGTYFVRLSNRVKILFDADGNVLFDSGN